MEYLLFLFHQCTHPSNKIKGGGRKHELHVWVLLFRIEVISAGKRHKKDLGLDWESWILPHLKLYRSCFPLIFLGNNHINVLPHTHTHTKKKKKKQANRSHFEVKANRRVRVCSSARWLIVNHARSNTSTTRRDWSSSWYT